MSEPNPRRILIVEDEMIIASRVAMLLERMGYTVAGILPRGEEVLDHCRTSQPDLMLMDIHLKGVLDGVETVTQLRAAGVRVPVIYLTANSDDASFERARATRPEGFVTKPYRQRELEMSLALAFSRQPPRENPSESAGADSTSSPDTTVLTDRIFVRQHGKMIRLPLDEVLFAEAARAYCRVVTTEGEHTLSMPLSTLERELPEQSFVRVHRSYLVNLRKIDSISTDELILQGRSVTLGRSYREELVRRLKMIR